MTSLYPTVHGILGYPYPGTLDPAAVTLAEILRSQGWRTAGFAEGGYAKGATGLDHGFQTFPDWPGDEASYISHELAPTRLAENARRASEWLDENAGGRFFLFFHTYEPHFEYHPPREALAAIAPEIDVEAERRALRTAVASWNARRRLSLEEKGLLHRHYLQGDLRSFALERPKRFWPMLQRFIDDQWQDSPNFAADLAYVTALYDAEIRFTDEVVSRLVAKLAELGLLERTLVVVTSDHGEGLMDHGFVQHGKNLYDELLRVPLIIRFPDGLGAGTRYGAQVRSLDILPTVLDWVGLPVPVAAQGESLLPLVRGEPAERLSYAEGVTFAGDERSIVMLRNERWKYVRHPFADREELYDLTADGAERVDLADGSAEILRGLRARLDQITAMNAARAQEYSVVPSTFTARERQRLEALGYAGGENE